MIIFAKILAAAFLVILMTFVGGAIALKIFPGGNSPDEIGTGFLALLCGGGTGAVAGIFISYLIWNT